MATSYYGIKEYGKHQYDENGLNDCKHGCGCYVGHSDSDGPIGLDPFGKCPKNPKDGHLLSENENCHGRNVDYEYVVKERIKDLESWLQSAENQLKAVEPDKIRLAGEIRILKDQIDMRNCLINQLRGLG